jgi:ribonuclease BN (tRNA processing enzyme)
VGSEGELVRIKVLGADGGVAPGFQTTSFLLNDNILIDGGSAATSLKTADQKKIDHIFISHSHLDHVKDICFLADNVFAARRRPIELISTFEILDILRKHLFNNTLWPDFTTITNGHCPILTYRPIESHLQIGDIEVRIYPVQHPVPAVGFVIKEKRKNSIVITGDTGPTDLLWDAANKEERLKAVFTEIAFPNRLARVAEAAGHFTPESFVAEMGKLKKSVPLLIYHLKPEYIKELKKEIKALQIPKLKLIQGLQRFTF